MQAAAANADHLAAQLQVREFSKFLNRVSARVSVRGVGWRNARYHDETLRFTILRDWRDGVVHTCTNSVAGHRLEAV